MYGHCYFFETCGASYGEHVQLEEAKMGHFMYAHEISSGSIPELASKLHVPKYFVNNFNDLESAANVTIDWMIRGTHFPSIFFGAPGSSSPLHSDGTSSWPWCRAPTNGSVCGDIHVENRPKRVLGQLVNVGRADAGA